MDKLKKCLELLAKYKQDIVLEELKRNNNEELIKQILEIDFEQLEKLYNQTKSESEFKDDVIESIEYTKELENEQEIRKIGEEVIKQGKYAVITMAGGQGTRLGHKGPKGTFKINVNSRA